MLMPSRISDPIIRSITNLFYRILASGNAARSTCFHVRYGHWR